MNEQDESAQTEAEHEANPPEQNDPPTEPSHEGPEGDGAEDVDDGAEA
jgi:hypothetical protein